MSFFDYLLYFGINIFCYFMGKRDGKEDAGYKRYKYNWFCPNKDCGFKASSNNVEVMDRARITHCSQHTNAELRND